MSAHSSKKSLYAALAANTGIAIAKFLGAAYTGSSAMVSEGIHSLVDTGNQLLLLHGMKVSDKPADAEHQFGYGLQLYFYGFVVALGIFGLGAGVSFYEGYEKIMEPHPIRDAHVNMIILAVSVLLEGWSLRIAFKGVKEEAKRKGRGIIETLRGHRDPAVFAIVYEESAAIAGLVTAFVGIGLSWWLDMPVLDGVTSILIGVILTATAFGLGKRCKTLLTGQAADPAIAERMRELLADVPCVDGINEIRTMQFSPTNAVATASVDFDDDTRAGTLENLVSDIEETMIREFPELRRVTIEPQSARRHLRTLETIGEDPDALEPEDDEEDEGRRED